MELPEHTTHSFIVRIWLEETGQPPGQITWRGHITHLLTNERRYVQSLEDISGFIGTYLEKMGAKRD